MDKLQNTFKSDESNISLKPDMEGALRFGYGYGMEFSKGKNRFSKDFEFRKRRDLSNLEFSNGYAYADGILTLARWAHCLLGESYYS